MERTRKRAKQPQLIVVMEGVPSFTEHAPQGLRGIALEEIPLRRLYANIDGVTVPNFVMGRFDLDDRAYILELVEENEGRDLCAFYGESDGHHAVVICFGGKVVGWRTTTYDEVAWRRDREKALRLQQIGAEAYANVMASDEPPPRAGADGFKDRPPVIGAFA